MNEKYVLGSEENRGFLKNMTKELLEFGRRFPANDGTSFYLGDDGTPLRHRDRETWITCRMAHVYSIGHILGFADCGELADAALRGIESLKDKENGGWYAGIRANGEHTSGKQCYAHAFVLLAASSALLAKREGADELLQEAIECFDRYFWDEEYGLTFDTWNTEFTELDDYRGLNANMHTVEAFLAVSDATGDPTYRERAGRIINYVVSWAEENSFRIPEHYTNEWKPDLNCNIDRKDDQFKPYGATPGHGIEWARLIAQWASITYPNGGATFMSYLDIAQNLYRRAITDAWNCDGAPGIVYTTDWEGKPVVHDRMHWTLAEAINTSAVLYEITKKQEYAEDYSKFAVYMDNCLHDHENGSWYHQLDKNNKPVDTVWPGKPDLYHAFQATLIPYMPADTSIAAAARNSIPIDVVALGELLVDFTENGTSLAGNPFYEANPGGAPCNVLSMLSRLGRSTAFIGMVGNDSFGEFLIDVVREQEIITDNLKKTDEAGTTLAFVHTASDGERSFSFYRNPGADMMLREENIDFRLLNRARIFHFGTLSMTAPGIEETTKKAVQFAREQEKLVSFDPNIRLPLWDNAAHAREMMRYGISMCDILKISDDEVKFLTGASDVLAGAEQIWLEYGLRMMCVTMGKGGSIVFYDDLKVSCPAYLTKDTIETTGAGDTFMGCILDAVLEHGIDGFDEASLKAMLQSANAAASVITTRRGALRVMPTREDILQVLSFHEI